MDSNAAKKALEKAQKAVQTAEQDAVDCDQRIVELKVVAAKAEEDALAINQACETAQAQLTAKSADLTTITKEFEQVTKLVDKIRSVQVELQNELDTYDRAVKEHEKKTKMWAQKIVDTAHKVHETFPAERIPFVDVAAVATPAPAAAAASEADMTDAAAPAPAEAAPASPAELLQALPARDEVEYAITMLEASLQKMKPNMGAIEEYRKKEHEYLARVRELDDMTGQRDAQRKQYEGLRKQRLDEFMAGFSTITLKLKEMYQMLTLGGDAELELVDSLDPFAEGIVFSVRPPKKSWKNIANLSGGEKVIL